MGHFKEGPSEAFWKGLQQHMGYTDEEMEQHRKDPKWMKVLPLMASPKMRNSTMVFEVVKSHGCAEGMKVGDATTFANLCHNMILQGIDPNDMYADHFACMDCGSEHGLGLGQIVVKVYVLDESEK